MGIGCMFGVGCILGCGCVVVWCVVVVYGGVVGRILFFVVERVILLVRFFLLIGYWYWKCNW